MLDFDRAGVMLSDGNKLGWDKILKAQTPPDRQEEFDRYINDLGLPLFRMKTRIRNADWSGAGEVAEPLLKITNAKAGELPNVNTAYLAHLSAMKSKLHNGDRTGAVWNFIQAATLQKNIDQEILELVGTSRLPERDLNLLFSRDILPIWFDLEQLEDIAGRLNTAIQETDTPAPGLVIYLASIQIERSQIQAAEDLLRSLESNDEEINAWKIILAARIQIKTGNSVKSQSMLEQNESALVGGARPAGFYYRGIAVLDNQEPAQSDDPVDIDRAKAILMLLRIPAIYGDRYRHLAAAALFQAAEIAKLRGLSDEAERLKKELMRQYSRTYHGSKKTTQINQ